LKLVVEVDEVGVPRQPDPRDHLPSLDAIAGRDLDRFVLEVPEDTVLVATVVDDDVVPEDGSSGVVGKGCELDSTVREFVVGHAPHSRDDGSARRGTNRRAEAVPVRASAPVALEEVPGSIDERKVVRVSAAVCSHTELGATG
jgi:hypothetical protein